MDHIYPALESPSEEGQQKGDNQWMGMIYHGLPKSPSVVIKRKNYEVLPWRMRSLSAQSSSVNRRQDPKIDDGKWIGEKVKKTLQVGRYLELERSLLSSSPQSLFIVCSGLVLRAN